MKLMLLAGAVLAATGLASPIEARDLHRVTYTFKDAEVFFDVGAKVDKIIREATGQQYWICNRALPPTCYPPPLETDVIEELEDLPGVIVHFIERE
ncbi:1,3-beta-glucan synthase component GLS2 [Purpureocillium lavendulum]|uniref:1,3-beta-glucan synthase component GLS2 n=1 Tax=Purpureocillium lavendulum TaxID=1247861 RepID=A0AB34FMB2_9HYPO|nr:1,3-beta-glucan synthase component GLS2 [Purpureocillium lavendulum]